MAAQSRNADIAAGTQLAVIAQGRVNGDRIRIYQDGTGWDASNGRKATPAQVAAVLGK